MARNKERLYHYGLPFDRKFAKTLESIKARIEMNKAGLIIIDGAVGEGKTTAGIHVADYMNGAYTYDSKTDRYTRHPDKFIDFSVQYGMGGQQFQERLDICIDKKKKVLVYDEAGDFNRRGALTKFNQQINRIFETYRTFNILLIVILPNAGSLDKEMYTKGVVRAVMHAYNRNTHEGRLKVYSLRRMFKILDKMKKLIVPLDAYSKVWPNYIGTFMDLEPDRAKELEAVSKIGKKAIVQRNIMESQGYITKAQIAVELNTSKQTVTAHMDKLGITPKAKKGVTYYYDRGVVEPLREQLKWKIHTTGAST